MNLIYLIIVVLVLLSIAGGGAVTEAIAVGLLLFGLAQVIKKLVVGLLRFLSNVF